MVQWYLGLAIALSLGIPGAALGANTPVMDDETAVAGHTTFAVLDISPRLPAPILGVAECKVRVAGYAVDPGAGLKRLGFCDEERSVLATPLAFPPPSPDAVLETTGRTRDVVDDEGLTWTTRELTFTEPDGTRGLTYGVPVGPTVMDPPSGEEYNFLVALPAVPDEPGWDRARVTLGPGLG